MVRWLNNNRWDLSTSPPNVHLYLSAIISSAPLFYSTNASTILGRTSRFRTSYRRTQYYYILDFARAHETRAVSEAQQGVHGNCCSDKPRWYCGKYFARALAPAGTTKPTWKHGKEVHCNCKLHTQPTQFLACLCRKSPCVCHLYVSQRQATATHLPLQSSTSLYEDNPASYSSKTHCKQLCGTINTQQHILGCFCTLCVFPSWQSLSYQVGGLFTGGNGAHRAKRAPRGGKAAARDWSDLHVDRRPSGTSARAPRRLFFPQRHVPRQGKMRFCIQHSQLLFPKSLISSVVKVSPPYSQCCKNPDFKGVY